MSLIDREKTIEEIPIDVCDGFEVTDIIEKIPPVQAIPLDKIKEAREQMINSQFYGKTVATYNDAIEDCVEILDKLIAESEKANENS